MVVSRRTRPALASNIAVSADSTVATPKASIADPTETCSVLFNWVPPCPKTVTTVFAPMSTVVVPPRKVSRPAALTNVASSTASVSPLRAATIPDTRSKPEPCTLLPAKTWLAMNDTVVGVAALWAPVTVVVVVIWLTLVRVP